MGTLPRVLVCTICRNLESNFQVYYSQLKNSVTNLSSDYDFFFSIYENDSTDTTKQVISNADWSFFKDWAVTVENLGAGKYSGNELERVKILATARNKCIEAKGFYRDVDWVLFVESDIQYTPEDFARILRHGDVDVDIFSGIAVTKDTRVIYDLWATRYSPKDAPTDYAYVFDLEPHGVKELWATFSCLCLYKAEPFKNGVWFHWMNERFGCHDCDTTVICENFRKAGYTKIFADYSINPQHPAENLISYAIHPGPNAEKLAAHIRSCVRRTDEVIIVDDPSKVETREYIFELWHDDMPSRRLLHMLQCVNNDILKTKPSVVFLPIMFLDFKDLHPTAENGAIQWPYWEPRLRHRSQTQDEHIKINPNGAFSIWKIKSFI